MKCQYLLVTTPALVGAAVAVPDLQFCAVFGFSVFYVYTFTASIGTNSPVTSDRPELIGAYVASIQLHICSISSISIVNIQA